MGEQTNESATVPTLDTAEREALHELRLGIEHVNRGYGHLLAFHHQVGRGMNRFAQARDLLREAGHDEFADQLRDHLLPAGVVDDMWSYELVEAFEEGFLTETTAFERGVRSALVEGEDHVTEREQQHRWRSAARD